LSRSQARCCSTSAPSLARVTAELEKLKAVETEDNRKDIVLLESLVSLNQRRELQEEAFRAHCVDQVCR
jgi:hypothetical protein